MKRANSDASWFSFTGGGSGKFLLELNGGQQQDSVAVNDGNWHNIVAIKTSNIIYYYVDGVAAGTSTSLSSIATTDVLTLGVWNNNGQYFPGSMDDVRVYNRALSATEISALYAGGK
jgi:hypothetical protein